jgi:curved DNA-binding protein CbpA
LTSENQAMPTQPIPDPYTILRVHREATSSQLRAAYRRLAKRYHPDLHADAAATEQMRRVNQAWEALSSPSRRADYDASVAAPAVAPYAHWTGPPRRTQPARAATPPWAGYQTRPAYAETGSDRSTGPLRWTTLLLIVPVTVLSFAILSTGILPFPLFGFLVILFAGRLFGRDG